MYLNVPTYFLADKRLIARKRQDTFEMCRIFTKENSKIKQYNKPIKSNTIKAYEISRRVKRGVAGVNYGVNPTLNDKDVRRVESIVDKLYDDMEEKGEKINYRQQNITKIIAKAKVGTFTVLKIFSIISTHDWISKIYIYILLLYILKQLFFIYKKPKSPSNL